MPQAERMKVEAITLREIRMPLMHPFETSFGRTTERRILLVTAHCDGIEGWGECTAPEDPFYNEESVETAWYVITRYLAPSLLGKPLAQPSDCVHAFAPVREHRMAKAAVESALWHAQALQLKQPLWMAIGGMRPAIECGVSVGIQPSIEQLLDKIETELDAGYLRIKIKIKKGWDIKVVERIRERWPDIVLSCDANSAYGLGDAAIFQSLEPFELLMIEQPLWADDIYFHSRLQRELRTAICLDESIRNARAAQVAADLGACRIINIKLGRVGGFTEAIKVHNLCASRSIPVWCGGMLESGIGRAHNIALSTLPNFSLPGDVSASKRYWKEDIIDPEVSVTADGLIEVPQSAGLGYEIKTDLIERLTVRKETLRPAAVNA